MNTKNKYELSLILYLSNEDYQKTIDSILAQDSEMTDVQLIIAESDTVKTDKEYIENIKQQYPENVVVCPEKYSTVQQAYKSAFKYTDGKYINFAECGCIYSQRAFSGIMEFFSINGDDEYIAVLRCSKSTKTENAAEINRRIPAKPKIINLKEKYNIPFIFFHNCFISSKLNINLSCDFETNELYFAKILADLFRQTNNLGIVKNAFVEPYQAERFFLKFYEDLRYSADETKKFGNDFLSAITKSYKDSFGFIPKYIQYNLLVFIEWCVNAPGAENIIQKAFILDDFKKILFDILNEIDDSIIIENSRLQLAHKYFLMKIKYGCSPDSVVQSQRKKLFFQNTKICDVSNNLTTIEFVTLTENMLTIQGRAKFIGCDQEDFSIFALVNKTDVVECQDIHHAYDTFIWTENVYPGMSFKVEIPLDENTDVYKIEFFSKHKGDVIKRNNIRFGKFSPLASNVRNCYYYSGRHIMRFNNSNSTITVEKATAFSKFKSELKYLKTLAGIKDDYAKHAFLARIMYRLMKLFHRKQIWLISDRTNRGDDNGEAFFKYMQTVKNNKIKCYFVIDKNCEEGKRISKIGKTISTNSKKHKLYHLLSTYVISSQANNPVVNPFLRGNIYYRDILCKNRFVFLQHGVIKDDLSSWLNIYNRNMFGFVVTTNPEYESILNYNYFYSPKEVWLTGIPRMDFLYNNEQKYITLMPTWRKSLMTHPDPVTGIWLIRDDFKESKYYKFYNSLMNDERLLKAAKEYGYKICFKPHPNIDPYINMFDKNENVIFMDAEKNYRDIFAETNLLLTDYSSVAFDFAYLRKPIVYAQFDREEFFSGAHSYTEGYFDYERDGFGEVEYNLEDTVNCLIDYIKNDCKPKEKYLDRINKTFAFSDKNCCERVYKKLLESNENK
ncbi:MAG: CDP-glycerol glycerophosphotransferase family protein [Clostridia bacterium]|nr:CDP-glycerol glycerophosphotransferase family protein [Clostridia bacterium]